VKSNISLEEAQEILFKNCPVVAKEEGELTEILGRVLAEDVVARENVPPFPRSPYDGYTFRSADTAGASKENPVVLEIIEEVQAGYAAKNAVGPGQAIKILTGAPIPEGADTVTKYEETTFDERKVAVYKQHKALEDIVPAGEDIALGEIIAAKGSVVSPAIMGLMAALGMTSAPMFKRPRIAIISTGDELCDISEPLTPGKIRNSSSYALQGYIKALGAEPVAMGTCPDKKEAVASLIAQGLEKADMVITTGGVSVGDYDVVRYAVDYLGAETLYWKIEIKPGSPTLAALKDGKMIIGLSGNPAAAMTTFQLLIVPYIKKMMGRADYLNPKIEVFLKRDFRKPSPRRRILRGKTIFEDGKIYMDFIGDQGNGVLRSMEGCNVLAEIPEKSGPVKAGEKLTAYLI